MITVFTPTYNRAYSLGRLYNSLLRQTNKNFEWLIVDDGSTDNTEALVKSFQRQSNISIRYFKQENGGKHRAINKGVSEAKGDLFFIVDSDDYLCDDSVDTILQEIHVVENDNSFCGVCGLRVDTYGKKVGGGYFEKMDTSFLNFRYKYNIKGDMAEVVRTEIMREFPFPEISGEKFCPEAVVWNRIAQKYNARYFYKGIYVCEYLPDGLTSKITKLRMQSPNASMICYSELSKYDIPKKQKIKAAINYWRFWMCGSKSISGAIKEIGLLNMLFLPAGALMHFKDLKSK